MLVSKKDLIDLNMSRHGVKREHKTLECFQKYGRPRRNDDRCERLLIQDTNVFKRKRI